MTPQMAQRSAAEVRAILMDHGGGVETAWVDCAEPGCLERRLLDAAKSDAALEVELRADGWLLTGGLAGVRCPAHRGLLSESTALLPYCAHDLSSTGAEGPVVDLGRWPVLWICDSCGAVHLGPRSI